MKIAQIKQLVSQHTGVSVEAMESRSEQSRHTCARDMVVWLCRKNGHSWGRILLYSKLYSCNSGARKSMTRFIQRRYRDWDLVNHSNRILDDIQWYDTHMNKAAE